MSGHSCSYTVEIESWEDNVTGVKWVRLQCSHPGCVNQTVDRA
ncbi:MAG TPA: hypothetical protein VGG75_38180 [Trebonia sp.]